MLAFEQCEDGKCEILGLERVKILRYITYKCGFDQVN